ncbi:hypothetical protein HQ489_01830 [Candidatus Woesearchaeota archaeon]|nr:hypothetical protein [Candidatus Woesearchaeota archaeon]
MNKKASVFHWIPLFLIGAFVFFMVMSNSVNVSVKEKGEWQTSFLQDFVYQGEVELHKLDQNALVVARKSTLQLASNGGYHKDSPCGKTFGLNKLGLQCFPKVDKEFSLVFNELFEGDTFDVFIEGQEVRGKGEKMLKVTSLNPKYAQSLYELQGNFHISLGYSFNEYDILKSDLLEILQKCNQNSDLNVCLDQHKKVNWKYSECGSNQYKSEGRTVPFCVEGSKILDEFGNAADVEYKFAVDFP